MIRHTRFVRGFGAWVDHEIAALQADCFALVMATGIISNTLYVQGYRALAGALFAVGLNRLDARNLAPHETISQLEKDKASVKEMVR